MQTFCDRSAQGREKQRWSTLYYINITNIRFRKEILLPWLSLHNIFIPDFSTVYVSLWVLYLTVVTYYLLSYLLPLLCEPTERLNLHNKH